jgi:hypothetical protein
MQNVGTEVLTAVVMDSSSFWAITPRVVGSTDYTAFILEDRIIYNPKVFFSSSSIYGHAIKLSNSIYSFRLFHTFPMPQCPSASSVATGRTDRPGALGFLMVGLREVTMFV